MFEWMKPYSLRLSPPASRPALVIARQRIALAYSSCAAFQGEYLSFQTASACSTRLSRPDDAIHSQEV